MSNLRRPFLLSASLFFLGSVAACAQAAAPAQATPAPADKASEVNELKQELTELRSRLAQVSARLDALEHSAPASAAPVSAAPVSAAPVSAAPESATVVAPPAPMQPASPAASGAAPSAQPAPTATLPQAPGSTVVSVLPAFLPGGATINYEFDGYYEYNFNQPPGRVNSLRAYDVLSNTFSVNQAGVIFALDPDLSKGRRYGVRVDLQFGQATDTLQGNPTNEPRPQIYQNIFQAYGTYVVPVGSGLNIDFGKWASSLGVEGNYSKDQINYTRSFYFYFLPFYHAGIRASYHVNDKFAVNYWVVNGANQSEPTNGYKDELFGFVVTPSKSITWTSNYYLGQEHPDAQSSTSCSGPVQPGLCLVPITPAPTGKLHIFDNYVNWQATPRLALTGEFDYVIEREWATAAPGESSAPSHVTGGAAYAQFQLNPKTALALRGEYLSDRGGLFSGTTQALKEATATYKYTLADGLDAFMEYRTDWSNVLYFATHDVKAPSGHQTTATLGLVWWYGGKQGTW